MISQDIQNKMFKRARQAGNAAGFEIESVVFDDEAVIYTWARCIPGVNPITKQELAHRFEVLFLEVNLCSVPEAYINDIFERQSDLMARILDHHLEKSA